MRARFGLTIVLAAALALVVLPARAQAVSLDDIAAAIVRLKAHINPDGRTNRTLGSEREGSAIVIDRNGLVLTIGYLMLEAYAAEVITGEGRTIPANVIAYDHETGFGLLRAIEPIKVKPIALGMADGVKAGDPVIVAAHSGNLAPARVVARREFAGSWEYLLDSAIFTAPPHPTWNGAALIGADGRLVGVGSLIVAEAGAGGPGNMFVPIDGLMPIMAELLLDGRADGGKRPWLGLNANDTGSQLLVGRVTPAGPAAQAGIAPGDVIRGVGGEPVFGLADFYRRVWARGKAGTVIPLDVARGGEEKRIDVKSGNRLDHLKLKSTF